MAASSGTSSAWLLGYVFVLGVVGLLAALWLRRSRERSEPLREADIGVAIRQNDRPNLRRRGHAMEQDNGEEESEEEEEREADYGERGENTAGRGGAGQRVLTAAEMKKATRKREKKEMKEARAAAIRSNEERKAEARAAYEERQAKREEEQLEKLEEERKAQELAEKAEEALYKEWKSSIVVEQTGSHEDDDMSGKNENLLARFIDYVKDRKIVQLEQLSAEFTLPTQQVVNRLKALEQQGDIAGIFDGRGKFIYISDEDMEQVAKYIRSKGRVSISELAKASNKLVSLS